MKLVIAEKPSVAQSLAAVLGANQKKQGYLEGGGWLVSWCVGHLVGLAPADLRSARLTAQWEKRLGDIAQGQEQEKQFVDEMRRYAAHLVSEVKQSDATYRHDNVSREKCPDCGKFLLNVQGKRGKMLVCPDRECGYRRSVTQTTNARCPNCHKKMELRGKGDSQIFVCKCGYKEKLSSFKDRRAKEGAGVSKKDVAKYLNQQKKEAEAPINSAFADAFAKLNLDKKK